MNIILGIVWVVIVLLLVAFWAAVSIGLGFAVATLSGHPVPGVIAGLFCAFVTGIWGAQVLVGE